MSTLTHNLNHIRGYLADNAPDATLIAVSKTQPQSLIDEAIAHGQRHFGENRLQEGQSHFAHLRDSHPDLTLHFIGQLQSRKVGDVVALFDVIHTLDRPKLVPLLADAMQKHGRNIPCLIQVNTGAEPQKGGVLPDALDALYEACLGAGLNIIGLMCIPPMDAPATPHFELLKKLADGLGLKVLSMGMSDDYEEALQAGASYIRVGSGLFGARVLG